MDSQFQQMMQVNIKGRVFVTCQAAGVTDPSIIEYYSQILEEAINVTLKGESTSEDFFDALYEQIAWLESELEQQAYTGEGGASAAQIETIPDEDKAAEEEPATKKQAAEKKASGYVPEAKSMPERLKDSRSVMEHLLVNDCVTLKLVSPKQAKKLKYELVGKDPEKAEEELVTILRNELHGQMSKFIRKHKGGPWVNATEQTEVRMEITRTKTLNSLVNLSRHLLCERQEWLSKTKTSLVGRLFGGHVKLDK